MLSITVIGFMSMAVHHSKMTFTNGNAVYADISEHAEGTCISSFLLFLNTIEIDVYLLNIS